MAGAFRLAHRGHHAHAPLEDAAVLDLAFHHKGQAQDAVPLSRARNRVASRLRAFKAAVNQELRALGLLDDERMLVRVRFLGFSIQTDQMREAMTIIFIEDGVTFDASDERNKTHTSCVGLNNGEIINTKFTPVLI